MGNERANRYLGSFLADRRSQARLLPKPDASLSPIERRFLVVTYAADLNRKPSGTKPVFT
jgi:hypothetical protein